MTDATHKEIVNNFNALRKFEGDTNALLILIARQQMTIDSLKSKIDKIIHKGCDE